MKRLIAALVFLICSDAKSAELQLAIDGEPASVVKCFVQTGLLPPTEVCCTTLPAMKETDILIIKSAEKVALENVLKDLQILTDARRP